MARQPHPWFRKGRGWYVTLDGKQHALGRDKRAAFARFHELMVKRPDQRPAAPASALEVFEEFLAWNEANRAPATFAWYQGHLQSFARALIEDRGAAIQAHELGPLDVRRWLARHANWRGGTQRQAIIAAQRAMNWAERMGYIDRSPLRSIEKPRASVRERIVSPAEYARLLALISATDPFRDLLVTSWETGCRPQESLRVEARHFDRANCRWIFPPAEAKGGRRPRIIYLTESALAITSRRVDEFPDGPLFRNRDGNPWTGYSVGCRFRRLARRVGTRYCLYHFRHTFATRMLAAGLDALTVALLLGHSNPAMVATTYQHLGHNPGHLAGQLRKASS